MKSARRATERRHYFYQGLYVTTSFPVPAWSIFAADQMPSNADVVITTGPEPREVGESTCILFVPELGRFHVNGGNAITVCPLDGIHPEQLQPWLVGPVWAALCYQRGYLLLHASAVKIGDEAVVFCGPPRSGKSTLAAYLRTQGHTVISDDLCRVEMREGDPLIYPPLIYPSVPRLKLHTDSLRAIGSEQASVLSAGPGAGKSQIWMKGNPISPLPLRGIYLLRWGGWRYRQLRGATALNSFFEAATYRRDLIASVKHSAGHMRLCIRLVSLLPVWEFQRPPDWDSLGLIVRYITN